MTTTATPAKTFLISAMGLEGGETLHMNNRTWKIVTSDISVPGPYMRAYYELPEGGMDWLVLRKCELVVVS